MYFFGAAAVQHRDALALIIFLLPLACVGSNLLAHWYDGIVSRVLYFCFSLWLGVGLTLLTAFAAAWVAWGSVRVVNQNPNPIWFGIAAVGLALVYSAYGVWNAYHPRIVRFSVRLKNLAPAWQGKNLVHLSDIHLGRILGARFLSRIVAKVNDQNPAMVFITGDLFDGSLGKLDELVAPLNRLNAPQGIYFVTGNHETYLGVQHAYAALRSTPVRVLDDERVVSDGLQVIGVSYPDRGHSLNFGKRMAGIAGFDAAQPSILLYHSPTQIAEAKAAGINLQLSGHVHQGQLFPLQFITRLIYGKYHHGLHKEGDFTLYTSSGTGLWGPTMRTGNYPEIAVIRLECA